jgi:hypothetical protein
VCEIGNAPACRRSSTSCNPTFTPISSLFLLGTGTRNAPRDSACTPAVEEKRERGGDRHVRDSGEGDELGEEGGSHLLLLLPGAVMDTVDSKFGIFIKGKRKAHK